MTSTAQSQDEPSKRRKPSDISVDEYLWAAEQTGALKGMARYLNTPYSSMHKDLHKRGIFTHVMNLLPEVGKPGARNVPPLASIEGAGPNPDWDIETIKRSAIARSDAKKARAEKKANQEIRFSLRPGVSNLRGRPAYRQRRHRLPQDV